MCESFKCSVDMISFNHLYEREKSFLKEKGKKNFNELEPFEQQRIHKQVMLDDGSAFYELNMLRLALQRAEARKRIEASYFDQKRKMQASPARNGEALKRSTGQAWHRREHSKLLRSVRLLSDIIEDPIAEGEEDMSISYDKPIKNEWNQPRSVHCIELFISNIR